MKNIALLILLYSVFSACKDSDKQAPQANEVDLDTITTRPVNEINQETISVLDQAAIFRFTKSNNPGFKWNSFQLKRFWKEDSMLTRPFVPQANFFDNYGPLLKYSPDSTKFIDLDSYNISIRKRADGKRIGHPQGPDTEVSLVDRTKKQSTRLIFLGPGSSIEDAAWLDNENLVLVSSVDHDGSAPNASLIKFNLPSKSFYVYETSDTAIIRNLQGYWKTERLKNVQMQ